MKVNIITGYSERGGSTIALIRLTNLLNEHGIDTTLYGPQRWHRPHCKSGDAHSYVADKDAIVISHLCQFTREMPCAKRILACHETDMFDMRRTAANPIDVSIWDHIVYVSAFQQQWQGVDVARCSSEVIPNIVTDLHKKDRHRKGLGSSVAGVIGSIDSHKLTHLSMRRALEEGYGTVEIYGKVSDSRYFESRVVPLLSRDVRYVGYCDDLQGMYDGLDAVFHSSRRETFSFVKFECEQTGVAFYPTADSHNDAQYWDAEKIAEAWMRVLRL